MTKKEIKNMGASVRGRLLEISRITGDRLDTLLLRYCQERFLYRLSISPYRNRLVLKGGLLFLAFNIPSKRPTKDMDLLGIKTADDQKLIESIFKDIISLPVDDGVHFDKKGMQIQKIKDDAEYGGQRILIPATLANARVKIQIDIGFGDSIVHGPVLRTFPVLLDHPQPEIFTYSPESNIAEKFEAIVRLGLANSRMKDFFDISFLARSLEFEMDKLVKAIDVTFRNRDVDIAGSSFIFSDDFSNDPIMNRRWNAFLRKSQLDDNRNFVEVVSEIEAFLNPVIQKAAVVTWVNLISQWQ